MLSSACRDALRLLVYLASKDDDSLRSTSVIAKELNLPFHFLSKTMQKLIKVGVLTSSRGINGGVKLLKKPADIRIFDIIQAIDGEVFFDKCILGISECQTEIPCALHSVWESKREELKDILEVTTIEELKDDVKMQKIKRL